MNVVSKRALAAKIGQVEGNTARVLLRQLLRLNAPTRPSAQMALKHNFFQPTQPADSDFFEEVRSSS